jgi:hypothetical protein
MQNARLVAFDLICMVLVVMDAIGVLSRIISNALQLAHTTFGLFASTVGVV